MNRSEPLSDELLSGYLDGELTADEQAQVEQWLASSAEHRLMVDELRALRTSFESLPCYQLDSDFSQRVLRRAEREMLSGPSSSSPPTGAIDRPVPRSRLSFHWRPVLALGVSLAAVMAFAFLGPMFWANQDPETSVVSTEGPSSSGDIVEHPDAIDPMNQPDDPVENRDIAPVPDPAHVGREPGVHELTGVEEAPAPQVSVDPSVSVARRRSNTSAKVAVADVVQVAIDGDDELVVVATADVDLLSNLLEVQDICILVDNGGADSPILRRARALEVAITAPDAWREDSRRVQLGASAGAGAGPSDEDANFYNAKPKRTVSSELVVVEATLDKIAIVMDGLAQASDEFTWAVVHRDRQGATQLNLRGEAARQLYQDAVELDHEFSDRVASSVDQRRAFRGLQEGGADVQDALAPGNLAPLQLTDSNEAASPEEAAPLGGGGFAGEISEEPTEVFEEFAQAETDESNRLESSYKAEILRAIRQFTLSSEGVLADDDLPIPAAQLESAPATRPPYVEAEGQTATRESADRQNGPAADTPEQDGILLPGDPVPAGEARSSSSEVHPRSSEVHARLAERSRDQVQTALPTVTVVFVIRSSVLVDTTEDISPSAGADAP